MGDSASDSTVLYNARVAAYQAGDPTRGYPAESLVPRFPDGSKGDTGRIHQPTINQNLDRNPDKPKNRVHQSKPINWSSLFSAQGPSWAMKLEHYPDLQWGKEAWWSLMIQNWMRNHGVPISSGIF